MCRGGVNRRGRRQHSRNPLVPPSARPLPGHPRAPVRPQRRAGRPPCLSVRAPSWSQGQQPRRRRGPRSNAGSRAPPHTLPSREGPRPTAMVPHTGAWELQTRRHGAHAWRRPAGRAVPPLSRRPSAPCVPASAGPAPQHRAVPALGVAGLRFTVAATRGDAVARPGGSCARGADPGAIGGRRGPHVRPIESPGFLNLGTSRL